MFVLRDGRAQDEHNACEPRRDCQGQRPLGAQIVPAAQEQRAAKHENGDPHAAHVVERHGRGQRQVGHGVEPCAHGAHANDVAPCMRPGPARGQRHAAHAHQRRREEHAEKAPVKNDLQRREVRGGVFHAHAHAGEEEGGGKHPCGLHDVKLLKGEGEKEAPAACERPPELLARNSRIVAAARYQRQRAGYSEQFTPWALNM